MHTLMELVNTSRKFMLIKHSKHTNNNIDLFCNRSRTKKEEICTLQSAENRIEIEINGMKFTRHKNKGEKKLGGFVSEMAYVDECAYIGTNALVLNCALVDGSSVVDGNAIVAGNTKITGDSKVDDNAIVYNTSVRTKCVIAENAYVEEAEIAQWAYIWGNATIIGKFYYEVPNALPLCIYGKCLIHGNATLLGSCLIQERDETDYSSLKSIKGKEAIEYRKNIIKKEFALREFMSTLNKFSSNIPDILEIYGNAKITENVKVYMNSKISGNAILTNNVIVDKNAVIKGNVTISNSAKITGNAVINGKDVIISNSVYICGKAKVRGNTYLSQYVVLHEKAEVRDMTIGGNTIIFTDIKDYIVISNIEGNDEVTSFQLGRDDKVYVVTRFFSGRSKDLIEAVKRFHGNSKYVKSYLEAIHCAKIAFKVKQQ